MDDESWYYDASGDPGYTPLDYSSYDPSGLDASWDWLNDLNYDWSSVLGGSDISSYIDPTTDYGSRGIVDEITGTDAGDNLVDQAVLDAYGTSFNNYQPIDFSSLPAVFGSNNGGLPPEQGLDGTGAKVDTNSWTWDVSELPTTGLDGTGITYNQATGTWETPAASSLGEGLSLTANNGETLSSSTGMGATNLSGNTNQSTNPTNQKPQSSGSGGSGGGSTPKQQPSSPLQKTIAGGMALAQILQALSGKGAKAPTPDAGNNKAATGMKWNSSALKRAEGGSVPGNGGRGALGMLRARTGGQDDVVPVAAAGGEYVMDADSVSALGDGNTEAGAAKLDQMRQNLRKHKRSAPSNKIPPKARSPLSYVKGAK